MTSNSSTFAPSWVKCAACALALLPFPGAIIAVTVNPYCWPLLTTTPIGAYVFLAGLNGLLCGRPPKAFFVMAADLLSGRFGATHDSRSVPRDKRVG